MDTNHNDIFKNFEENKIVGMESHFQTHQMHIPLKIQHKDSDKFSTAYFMVTTGSGITYISYETLTELFGYEDIDIDKSNPIATNCTYMMPLPKTYYLYPVTIPCIRIGSFELTNQTIYTYIDDDNDVCNILGNDILGRFGGVSMGTGFYEFDGKNMDSIKLIHEGHVTLYKR